MTTAATYRPYPGHPLEQPVPYALPRLPDLPMPEMPLPLLPIPAINPDRRACAGCVGPGGVAELQRRLYEAEVHAVAWRQMVTAGNGGEFFDLYDTTQTPNERAYDALMAERQKRQRAGAEVGRMLRLHDALAIQAHTQVANANRRADELQRKANSIPLLEDKIDRLKAENLRLLGNELAFAVSEVLTNGHRPRVQVVELLGAEPVKASLAERARRRAYTERDDDDYDADD